MLSRLRCKGVLRNILGYAWAETGKLLCNCKCNDVKSLTFNGMCLVCDFKQQ